MRILSSRYFFLHPTLGVSSTITHQLRGSFPKQPIVIPDQIELYTEICVKNMVATDFV